jgi:hypothetical protein
MFLSYRDFFNQQLSKIVLDLDLSILCSGWKDLLRGMCIAGSDMKLLFGMIYFVLAAPCKFPLNFLLLFICVGGMGVSELLKIWGIYSSEYNSVRLNLFAIVYSVHF